MQDFRIFITVSAVEAAIVCNLATENGCSIKGKAAEGHEGHVISIGVVGETTDLQFIEHLMNKRYYNIEKLYDSLELEFTKVKEKKTNECNTKTSKRAKC